MNYWWLCEQCGLVSRRRNKGSGQPVFRSNRLWRWQKKQICSKLGSEKHEEVLICQALSLILKIPLKWCKIVFPHPAFYCGRLPQVNLYLFVCTQVEVQCEQLSRELARHREQLEREAQALQERLAEAREEGRAEARKQKEELSHTVNLTYSLLVCVENYCRCIYFQPTVLVALRYWAILECTSPHTCMMFDHY